MAEDESIGGPLVLRQARFRMSRTGAGRPVLMPSLATPKAFADIETKSAKLRLF
jgi:hypothetical protein